MTRKALLFGLLMLFVSGLAHAAMQLPDSMKEIPVFAGSKITQAMEMENTSTAMFTLKAQSDAILDFYKQNMKSRGWKTVFQAEQEDSAIITFSSGKQILQLSVHKKGDDGTLEYILVLTTQK
jgi:hypothetical protein